MMMSQRSLQKTVCFLGGRGQTATQRAIEQRLLQRLEDCLKRKKRLPQMTLEQEPCLLLLHQQQQQQSFLGQPLRLIQRVQPFLQRHELAEWQQLCQPAALLQQLAQQPRMSLSLLQTSKER